MSVLSKPAYYQSSVQCDPIFLTTMVLLESSISQYGWRWKASNFVLSWIRGRILRDVVEQVVARDWEMSYQHAWRVSGSLMFIELCWMIGPFRHELAKTNKRWASKLLLSIEVRFCTRILWIHTFFLRNESTWKDNSAWEKLVEPTQHPQKGQESQPVQQMWNETERQNWRNLSVLQSTSCFASLPVRVIHELLLISSIHLRAFCDCCWRVCDLLGPGINLTRGIVVSLWDVEFEKNLDLLQLREIWSETLALELHVILRQGCWRWWVLHARSMTRQCLGITTDFGRTSYRRHQAEGSGKTCSEWMLKKEWISKIACSKWIKSWRWYQNRLNKTQNEQSLEVCWVVEGECVSTMENVKTTRGKGCVECNFLNSFVLKVEPLRSLIFL